MNQAVETSQAATPAEERQWAMLAHLSALSALFTGGAGALLGPLIVWLLKRDTMPFVDAQAKEALNFNITAMGLVILLIVVGTPLLLILVGFALYFAAAVICVAWLVLTVVAAAKAHKGVVYRYPVAWRLIK